MKLRSDKGAKIWLVKSYSISFRLIRLLVSSISLMFGMIIISSMVLGQGSDLSTIQKLVYRLLHRVLLFFLV